MSILDSPERTVALTLPAAVAAAADRFPDAIALDLGPAEVTYAELLAHVHRFADRLAALDLPPGSRVALHGVRALPTYVAYLATMWLGHTVVPLNPDSPPAFHDRVIRLAEVGAIVVPPGDSRPTGTGVPMVTAEVDDGPARTGAPIVTADAVAYILFTSGSTGTPKGVPVRHSNVMSFLREAYRRYELGPGCRLSHTFALTFDPSVFDIFGAFTTGSTLVVPRNRELLSPPLYANARRLTHWYSVPSLARFAIRTGLLRPGALPDLRWSMFSGEALDLDVARAWLEAAPNAPIENAYGPTEVTINCTGYVLGTDPTTWPTTPNGTVPIGPVYGELDSAVVDDDGRPTDHGELLLRGPQRVAGYLDPADDAGRFARAADGGWHSIGPDQPVTDDDWYRTGDRVERSADGLVHLGRVDRQVKVSGHRDDLDEVARIIRDHPAVADAAAYTVPGRTGGPALAAAFSSPTLTEPELRAALASRWPRYMVPDTLLPVDELPLNTSGKIDYQRLRTLTS